MTRKRDFYLDEEVFTDNSPRVFEGEYLSQIRFPLGGIGTGTISLGGRGELRDWEIFNRPNRDSWLPYNLFILRVSDEERITVRVLEREWLPPYDGTRGVPEQNAPGFPRFRECAFVGEYPFAQIDFQDDGTMVDAKLEAFNPFIPPNIKDSGLPVAIFNWELANTSNRPLDIDVYCMLYNACGYAGEKVGRLSYPNAGRNLNRFVEGDTVRGIAMSNEKLGRDHPCYGTMAVSTTWPKVEYKLRFDEKYQPWVNLQDFWEGLEKGERLPNDPDPEPSSAGRTQLGVVSCQMRLEPGQKVKIPFFISWHFPNRGDRWGRAASTEGVTGNYYATLFDDAWEVAKYVGKELPRLYEESKRFQKAFYSSTIPGYALEAITATLSVLRTNSCFIDAKGRFFGYEGCSPEVGCCPGTCTHVWNYAQSVAYLFPSLERSARRTEFLLNTTEEGAMPFRTPLPPGVDPGARVMPAADGQMGCVLRAYREWLISGDANFLKEIWPNARKALEFAWKRWDKNRDGIMEEDQHNTTDIEYYGPNPYVSYLYIAALKAAAEMADAMDEGERAQEYRRIAESGKNVLDTKLWNGEYYEQDLTGWEDKPHQLGKACSSDQVMGQWYADMLGLESLMDTKRLRSTLEAIFKYNWQTDLHNVPNVRRAFAINDEQAVLFCTWPDVAFLGGKVGVCEAKGDSGKPHHPIFRSTEVWTGIEYMVASHLMYIGMVKEGLSIVKGIRERHDGKRRNPWNEPECGDHYTRAMSSWAVLLALSGFRYSAPERKIQFAPRLNVSKCRVFWSVGEAWGTYGVLELAPASRDGQGAEHEKISAELEVCYGSLKLKIIWLDWKDIESGEVILKRDGEEKDLKATFESKNGVRIELPTEMKLKRGDILRVVGY